MGLLDSAKKLTRSDKGKEALGKAKDAATDPDNKKKLTDAADKVEDTVKDTAKKVKK